jgi:hypothetical protein
MEKINIKSMSVSNIGNKVNTGKQPGLTSESNILSCDIGCDWDSCDL